MQNPSVWQHKEQVTTRFNATAGGYDTNQAIRACAQGLLSLVALETGEQVLDVACGTGNLTLLAAATVGPGGHVVGVDLTEGMLAQASIKARGLGLTNVELSVGDAERLEVEDESFDVVLCGLGIQFVPDRLAAAREWYRALRPGGRAAFSTWRQGFGTPALRQLLNARLATFGLNGTSISDPAIQEPEACRRLLDEAGFVDTRVLTEQHGFFFARAEDYWKQDVVGSITGALLTRLQPHDLARFREAHLAEVSATASSQGIWRDASVNFAIGVKPSERS